MPAEIFELRQDKIFNLQEANALLPILRRITNEAVAQIESLQGEEGESAIIERWSQKILKLGCRPKGLWLVDFDNGEGYYCWHYPEENVEFSLHKREKFI